ncbi:MAG: shikimate kinase [Acidobacteriota bacterium]
MNLVLIGYRGTGKSTLGKLAAERLGMPYVSSDEEIVRRAGRSIPEIVAASSWQHFRDLEETVIADLASRDGWVIDTGGGVVTRPPNVQRLREHGFVVWLQATVRDIVERIRDSSDRPSLTGDKDFLAEVEEVLAERLPLYEAAADLTVDTSALGIEEAVDTLVRAFRDKLRSQG